MATYENSFKEEAVRLSDDVGVKQAAAQLGIPYWTLADWRAARKAKGSQAFVGSGHKRLPTDEKERRILELEKENNELKRANVRIRMRNRQGKILTRRKSILYYRDQHIQISKCSDDPFWVRSIHTCSNDEHALDVKIYIFCKL